jgi:hypothetical protein
MDNRPRIRRAQSCSTDERQAVRELHAGVVQPEMALVIFFCSSEYDLAVLADEMRLLFAGVQVVGCTTAGEIGPAGYLEHSLTGASFPASLFKVVSGRIDGLQAFQAATGQAFTQELLQKLESEISPGAAEHRFALLLSGGLAVREELITRVLQGVLGRLPLLGGSAGDGVNFGNTYVYFEGRFCTDSALLMLLSTNLPIKLFMTQHFVATEERLVVTEADPARRVVKEINGLPAAEEYARLLGVAVRDLSPKLFAAWPVVVLINGTNYVRAIRQVNPDGSLTFFCAIENGLVFRVAKGVDLLANLEQALARVREAIGPPQLVLGCDCILRHLEIEQSADKERVGALLLRNNTTGFSTYGEQLHGVHVNQTFVGVALGADPTERAGA